MEAIDQRESQRIAAIDRLRGLAILAMVAVNFGGGVAAIPAWLKHAPDIGFTVADLVAPLFIFAIGLTYRRSYMKRVRRDGTLQTVLHFVTRYLAIAGIGAVLSAGELAVLGQPVSWGVLQAIGMAGLVTLVFISLDTRVRLAAGIALLVAYQVALDTVWLRTVLGSSHGGLYGSLSWSAMLILSTVAADCLARGRGWFAACAAFFSAAAAVAAALVPVSKNRVSLSYVLLSIALSCLIYLAFDRLGRHSRPEFTFLEWWGSNPLLLYVLHLMLLGVCALPAIPGWYAEAPLWLSGLQLAGLIAALGAIARALHRRKIVISL